MEHDIDYSEKPTRDAMKIGRPPELPRHIRLAYVLLARAAERGEIPDHQYRQAQWGGAHIDEIRESVRHFGHQRPHCGSAQCVGGWVESLLRSAGKLDTSEQIKAWDNAQDDAHGKVLFAAYPDHCEFPTVRQMGRAIRAYLRGAEQPWAHAKRRR